MKGLVARELHSDTCEPWGYVAPALAAVMTRATGVRHIYLISLKLIVVFGKLKVTESPASQTLPMLSLRARTVFRCPAKSAGRRVTLDPELQNFSAYNCTGMH